MPAIGCAINRYYTPQAASFLSVDPLVAQTGEPYAFTGGDPLNASDPLGLEYFWVAGHPNPRTGTTWHTYQGFRAWEQYGGECGYTGDLTTRGHCGSPWCTNSGACTQQKAKAWDQAAALAAYDNQDFTGLFTGLGTLPAATYVPQPPAPEPATSLLGAVTAVAHGAGDVAHAVSSFISTSRTLSNTNPILGPIVRPVDNLLNKVPADCAAGARDGAPTGAVVGAGAFQFATRYIAPLGLDVPYGGWFIAGGTLAGGALGCFIDGGEFTPTPGG